MPQKNFLMSQKNCDILKSVMDQTGLDGVRIMELGLELFAIKIGVEVTAARQYLYDNLMLMVVNTKVNPPIKLIKTNKKNKRVKA